MMITCPPPLHRPPLPEDPCLLRSPPFSLLKPEDRALPEKDFYGTRSRWKNSSLESLIPGLESGRICIGASSPRSGPPLSNACLLQILHRCSKERDHDLAMRLHAFMCDRGYEVPPALGNHLISMMLSADRILDARYIFDSLRAPDECSWSSLIVGYVKCGEPKNALLLYGRMQEESHISPCARTFAALLKACAKLKDLEMGCKLHRKVAENRLLEKSLFVGSSLVDMYAKCSSSLEKAQEVFDGLPAHDVVSWNALIAGYVNHDRSNKALELFEQMQLDGIVPNAITYVFTLKACASVGDRQKGEEIHAEIARNGLLRRHAVVGNVLVDMYAKCGSIGKAQEVFDHLSVRDVVSWNALIAGYAKLDHDNEALNCFEAMLLEGAFPDPVTFIHVLKACSSVKAVDTIYRVHDEITRNGHLERRMDVANALVDTYARRGMFAEAQDVFDKLTVRDTVSWNSLIGGYCKHGFFDEAKFCFQWMQQEGIPADTVTFICNLKVCTGRREPSFCFELHSSIIKRGLEKEDLLISSLIDAYSKLSFLAEARLMFDALSVKDAVSWTALLTGYAQHGYFEQALQDIELMQAEGMNPDAVTYVSCIKSCTNLGDIVRGLELHAQVTRKGLDGDLLIGSMLVDMYAKCGLLFEAEEVFQKLPVRGVIAWNVLVAAYIEHELDEKAITCFDKMQLEGVPPNAATYVSILKACGYLGALSKGQDLHNDIKATGPLETDLTIRHSLVDMYAKSGSIAKAQELFDDLPVQELASWNALLAGYAQNGAAARILHALPEMNLQHVRPNLVTFVNLLNACNHAGLVYRGQMYFKAMSVEYHIIPSLEHYTCMVNLFCRAGQLHEAVGMIERMPMYPDFVIWRTFLGACQKWGNVELGRDAFDRLIESDEVDSVSFIYMSNICADAEHCRIQR